VSGWRLLLADDEAGIRGFVGEVARDLGFEIESVAGHGEFLEVFRSFKPALIVLDLQMTGGDGVELLRALARERCEAGVLLLSAVDSSVRRTALQTGADLGLKMIAALAKPIRIDELEHALVAWLEGRGEISAAELQAALDERQLWLQFQPKIDLRSGRACGCEALARWDHPRRGRIAPDRFVPRFESEGLVGAMTHFVLEAACRQLAAWRGIGVELRGAVNLSPALLGDLSLPEQVEERVARSGLPPSAVLFEVTETGAMSDPLRAAEVLSRFRSKGFELSLDDFGTGHSSLVWLYRLPFSELKIDRSFVSEMTRSDEARLIVESTIQLAHGLGLEVCAEGVETREAYDALAALGCDRAQGYLIGRPLDAGQMPAWLASWKAAHD
jgi:EAL domain-containing protein (putative c-di-GMP-specific phosphodiesterase class I)